MKLKLSITGLVAALVMAALMGGIAAETSGRVAGIVTFIVAFGVPLLQPLFPASWYGHDTGLTLMAIQTSIWKNHIVGDLYRDNQFMKFSVDSSQFVQKGRYVYKPHEGAAPSVVVDRSSFPASATQRTDTAPYYELKAYSTNPVHMRDAETFELSYNKRESLVGQSSAILRQRVADGLIGMWAATESGKIIRTTGAPVNTHLASTAGTRKLFTLEDLNNAQLIMDEDEISIVGRRALFSARMLKQLTDQLSANEQRDFIKSYDPTKGIVGELFGFTILKRSRTVSYNEDASAVNAYGAVVDDADNDAVICWQDDAVERAQGSMKFFTREDDPLYYGDIYSMELRFGGDIVREDQRGVVAIVQVAA